MKITGIVAEFDPFHNGHKYLVEQARGSGSTHIVSVMSGSFLQRGKCASADKFSRARAAVLGGVDLVVELPQVFACSSAERFAEGAVGVLEGFGCVDELFFGSECGDAYALSSLADDIGSDDVKTEIKRFAAEGMSYPAALKQAVSAVCGDISCLLDGANNTLALEYIKALKRINSKMMPSTVKRSGAAHDSAETTGDIASASAVRELVFAGDESYKNFIPKTTAYVIEKAAAEGACPASLLLNERGVLSVLKRMSLDDIKALPDVSEGLENRIFKAVRENNTIEDIIVSVKCKRYTYARLSRMICCAYLGITAECTKAAPGYIRVLAFNDRGAEVLKIMKNTASLPVLMKAKDFSLLTNEARRMLNTDITATALHGLCSPKIQDSRADFYRSAIKL